MNEQDAIPVESSAVQLRDPALPPPPPAVATTPAQARVDAVASLTMKAYERASMLNLTPEECAALKADFPDEAFKPGAGGKENLIYIEHAFLRDRLNNVFGLGQWAIVPRSRWGEDFKTTAGDEATRIYVEAMLLVRGCFVAESVGDMVYYKKNQTQNYGDAVEGAKTAALRRCAKELGIGLQAWKKDWCAGWWERESERRRSPRNALGRSGGSQDTAQRPNAAPAPQPASRPAARTEDVAPQTAPPAEADSDQRFRFLAALSDYRTDAMRYFVAKKWITDLQSLEQLPNQYVPTTKKAYDSVMAELKAFMDGDRQPDALWWKAVCVPFGAQQGTPIGELDKKKLYGWVKNYEVEESYNGVRKPQAEIDAMLKFREALDAAEDHYEF